MILPVRGTIYVEIIKLNWSDWYILMVEYSSSLRATRQS